MVAKRLLETDPCPCASTKPFSECCRGELKPGHTPENSLHLFFEETDMDGVCASCLLVPPPENGPEVEKACMMCSHCTCAGCASVRQPLKFYATQTLKMNGEVPADEIVENISKRLWSPPMVRALDRLNWQAANSKGLRLKDVAPPPPALLDKEGNPLK